MHMRKILTIFFIFFLIGYAEEIKNVIIVTGEGVVESEPDLATIHLGVSLQDRTADKVYQQVNSLINQLMKSLQDNGIKKEDIKTEGIGLYPQYEYPDGKQRLVGYQMYHNLSIRVKDIKKIADVIDYATLAGANTISSINFGFQEPEKLESQARAKAITAAQKKGQELARGANLNLGKIIQITESSYPAEFGGYDLMKAGGASSAMIARGVSSVRVSVTITFAIQSQ